MGLKNVQSLFSDALSRPQPDGGHHAFERLIRDTGRLSPAQRLAIYRETGLSARVSALCQIYPVCQSILGTDNFDHLARDYAQSNRSDSPDLNQYGTAFADFIGNAIEFSATLNEYRYLRDLCVLEWLWHSVYYREDDDNFDFSEFTRCSERPECLTLRLSQSLELMTSPYPVNLIWKQHREQQPPASVSGLDEPDYLCIFRTDYLPTVESVSKPHYELLNVCRQGYSLADMASHNHLTDIMQELPVLIQRGWITGFRLRAD